METGTRAMASRNRVKLTFVAASLTLALTSCIPAFAADNLHYEDWQTLRPGQRAYLNGDGGGVEKTTVCESIARSINSDARPGCYTHAIGTVVTINAKTGVNDPLSGSPVVSISGQGFSGYVEAVLLAPAIPINTRLRVVEPIGLHRHLEGMNPLVDDFTVKSGFVEVLTQAPYQDGMWVKVRVLQGKNRGVIGWVYPVQLNILFYR